MTSTSDLAAQSIAYTHIISWSVMRWGLTMHGTRNPPCSKIRRGVPLPLERGHKLYFIWQTSLFKTLAWKHKASVTKIATQLRGKRGYESKLKTTKGYAIYKVFSLKDLKGFRVDWKTVDVKPRVLHFTLARTEITQRLQAQK